MLDAPEWHNFLFAPFRFRLESTKDIEYYPRSLENTAFSSEVFQEHLCCCDSGVVL